MNRKGEIFILDRIKVKMDIAFMGCCLPFGQEMLKVQGYQVAPAELEGYILGHLDVSDMCIVGILNEYSGELPLTFVVLWVDASQRT